MTPRATMSTRVLETIDIITAILSTPGFSSTSLASPHALRTLGIAADLAVVGRPAAVGADGVEERQRAAAGADHEPEVAVELGHVARHAAVVHRRRPPRRRARTRWPRAPGASPPRRRRARRAAAAWRARASFSMSMCASSATNEPSSSSPSGLISASVMSRCDEQPRERGEDRHEPVELASGDADGGDDLLGLVVAERQDGREVPAPDVVGVALGDLLDVDAAHVAEEHHRLLADPVPHDAGVVLLRDRRLRVDEHAARHVAVDLEREDVLGLLGRLVRACRRTARRRPSSARR